MEDMNSFRRNESVKAGKRSATLRVIGEMEIKATRFLSGARGLSGKN